MSEQILLRTDFRTASIDTPRRFRLCPRCLDPTPRLIVVFPPRSSQLTHLAKNFQVGQSLPSILNVWGLSPLRAAWWGGHGQPQPGVQAEQGAKAGPASPLLSAGARPGSGN